MEFKKQKVDWSQMSREWDIRINLGEDNIEAEAEHFIAVCKKYIAKGNVSYLLVGGIEIGDNPAHTSFEKAHLHVAIKLNNRISRKSIKDKLELNRFSDGTRRQAYYEPRDQSLSYSGWISHHMKERTKIDKTKLKLFEHGSRPADKRKYEGDSGERLNKAEYNKKKGAERYQEMLEIFRSGTFDDYEMCKQYGAAWSIQKAQFLKMFGAVPCCDPPLGKFPDGKNLLIYGPPGHGKSAYVAWKFPKCFKRNALNYKFWDGFKPSYHTHILYDDMDRKMFNGRDIGPGQWKVWLDPHQSYSGEIKFQAPLDNIRHPVVITSNYHWSEWFQPGYGIETDKEAMKRRLTAVHIDDLLKSEGIRLIPEDRRPKNTTDPSQLFEPYDWSLEPDKRYVTTFNP